MRRLRLRLGRVATNQENTSMHSLLRSAAAAVIVLGLSGAAPEARADVVYDSFGQLFDAIVSGDHSGQRSHSVNHCSGSYSGCSGNAPALQAGANRPGDRDEPTDRGGPARNGGENGNTGGDGGNTGGDGDGSDGDGDGSYGGDGG